MPILEIPSSESPLTQGDILQGIAVFETLANWPEEKSTLSSFKYCMVVSRPCVAVHKTKIVVVGVEAYKEDKPADLKTFKEIKGFLEAIRDGERKPDCFYLGHLPESPAGRYRAKFDSFFTIQVDQTQMGELLKQHRIARLCADFARDLHTRLFHAFASLGFDDVQWYSDEDLIWLVSAATKELAEAQQSLAALQSEGAIPKALSSAKEKFDERQAELAPLQEELKRRRLETLLI